MPISSARRAGVATLVLGGVFVVACGSRSGVEACAPGTLDCICYPDATCDPGLTCSMDRCTATGVAGELGNPGVGGSLGVAGSGGAPDVAGAGGRRPTPSTGGRPQSAGAGGQLQTAGAPIAGGSPPAAGGSSEAGDGGVAGAPVGGSPPAAPPAVLLLIDGSTSMLARQVWNPTYEALMGESGPIQEYQHRVRFGFASYRGTSRTHEEDPACADITSVSFSVDNHAAIRDAYSALGTMRGGPWETPTGHAILRVTQTLLSEPSEVRKNIVLISDGVPDTCATTTPQCGQDRAIFAIQEAFRAGIVTYAIGIGFGLMFRDCTPETARCGSDHFQDLANAGRGLPVVAPPAAYAELPCIAGETGGQLLASYAPFGGSAPYAWTSSPREVADAVRAALREIVGEPN